MKKYVKGDYVEMTVDEIAKHNAMMKQAECDYWQNVSYDEAVNAEIRKRYTESQEFAILRQRDEKPEEYAKYYSYCEECKAYIKEMKALTE